METVRKVIKKCLLSVFVCIIEVIVGVEVYWMHSASTACVYGSWKTQYKG